MTTTTLPARPSPPAAPPRTWRVTMLVDLRAAMPVAGPYADPEHARDAWELLASPGVDLSHLTLTVTSGRDLVTQVAAWRELYIREYAHKRCC
jgi:hypothetical protein